MSDEDEVTVSTRLCIHPHPKGDLDNSLAAHIDMETMLAVQLAQTNTALRSARAALLTATKRTLQDTEYSTTSLY